MLVSNINLEHQPEAAWYNSYPDINIVGYPKTGTSHMYRILEGHARIASANMYKEFCYCCPDEIQRKSFARIHAYRKQLYIRRLELNDTSKLTVNGCIYGSPNVEVNYRYIPPRGEKFIVLYRDPADWLWAAWNFWVDPLVDNATSTFDWANAQHNYRSPELFHEIVASNGKLRIFNNLFSRLQTATWDGMRTIELVGRSNVLFVRNEDIEPSTIESSGTLERLSTFLSIKISEFGSQTLSERTNCNNVKGEKAICNNNSKSGLYDVSGKQPMLDKTRRLIYAFCQSACIMWYEKFDLDYPHCRNRYSITNDGGVE